MTEPIFLGHPVTRLILYFFFYAFLGWVMETCYCSVLERRYVARGFLYGPICPIYGVGVLLMVLFFKPLSGMPVVFYVTAVVVMSAWEYLVGWLLEVTTHIKYWDYSHFRFNLNGRICLPISLTWGVLSYIVIYWVHPMTERLFGRIPPWLSYVLCGAAIGVLISDATLTIRELALISKLTQSVSRLSGELQLQLSLGRAELDDRLDERSAAVRARYNEQLHRLERYSRRFLKNYHIKPDKRYHVSLEDLKAAAELAREEMRRAAAARKREREERRAAR